MNTSSFVQSTLQRRGNTILEGRRFEPVKDMTMHVVMKKHVFNIETFVSDVLENLK